MKRIATPVEPPCLSEWRSLHPNATWEAFRNENRDSPNDQGEGCASRVLKTLLTAQYGLCAFCEISLDPPLWAQVEHWHPKDPRQDLTHNWGLDFSNFMAGCEGGERDKPDRGRSMHPISETRHCGPAKDNLVLVKTLLDPRRDIAATPPIWRFDATGRMSVIAENARELTVRAESTIKLLNLDSRVLKRLRAELWRELDADVLRAWEALGGTEESYRSAYEGVAADRLAVKGGLLESFWSMIRSFFNEEVLVSEEWIAKHPEVFDLPRDQDGE